MLNNNIIQVFIDYFWEVAEAIVPLLAPIIGIMLIFKIIHELLLRRN